MTRPAKTRGLDAGDNATPILVPKGIDQFRFGDHLRHLAEHAGIIPATLDEFGRCLTACAAAGSSWTLNRKANFVLVPDGKLHKASAP